MTKTIQQLEEDLIAGGWPVKEVQKGGKVAQRLQAPSTTKGIKDKKWRAYRKAKAAARRPERVE